MGVEVTVVLLFPPHHVPTEEDIQQAIEDAMDCDVIAIDTEEV